MIFSKKGGIYEKTFHAAIEQTRPLYLTPIIIQVTAPYYSYKTHLPPSEPLQVPGLFVFKSKLKAVLVQQKLSYADGGNARFIAPRTNVVMYDDNLPKRIADTFQWANFLCTLFLMRNGEGRLNIDALASTVYDKIHLQLLTLEREQSASSRSMFYRMTGESTDDIQLFRADYNQLRIILQRSIHPVSLNQNER